MPSEGAKADNKRSTKRELRSSAGRKRAENKEAKGQKQLVESKPDKDKSELATVDDDSHNQGFGEWLRSNDGIEMMRLFVVANSILVFVTMAWPHMKETFHMARDFIFGEEEDWE